MIRTTLASCVLLLASCSSESPLKTILETHLPDGLVPTLNETCSTLMGPAVGLFSLSKGPEENIEQVLLKNTVQGRWSRASSLAEFTRRDKEHMGSGIGATILDGKNCLRKIDENAEETLFGATEGFYFRSENREVVIVIFDHPTGNGVIFVQAP